MPHTFHIATYASHQLFGFQCNILPCGSIDRLGVAVSLNKLDTSPPSPALKAPPFWHVASSSEFRLYFAQQIFHSENSQIFSDPEQHLELVRWCQEACLHANNALIYTPQGRMASIWSNISVKRTIQKVNRPLQIHNLLLQWVLKTASEAVWWYVIRAKSLVGALSIYWISDIMQWNSCKSLSEHPLNSSI